MRSNRENESLKLVTDLLNQNLKDIIVTESSDPYAHYDLLVSGYSKPIYIEVKERMNRYVQPKDFILFSKQGWQLEMIKYNFLVGKPNRYINLFRVNGEIIIMTWDVNIITKKYKELYCKQTTEFEYQDWVNKDSLLLTPEMGTTYILKNNKYEVIDFKELITKLTK